MQQMTVPQTADASQGPLVRRLFRWLKSPDRQPVSGTPPASDRVKKPYGSPRVGVERSMSHGPVLVKTARDLPIESRASMELTPSSSIPRKASVGCITSGEIGRCFKRDDEKAAPEASADSTIPASSELFDISFSDLASHPASKDMRGGNADENRIEARDQNSPKFADVAAYARGTAPGQPPATATTQPKGLLSQMLRPRRSPSPKQMRVLLDSNKKVPEPPTGSPVPPPAVEDVKVMVLSASVEGVIVEEQKIQMTGLFYAAGQANESAGEAAGEIAEGLAEAVPSCEESTMGDTIELPSPAAQQIESTEAQSSEDCMPAASDAASHAADELCNVDVTVPVADVAACDPVEVAAGQTVAMAEILVEEDSKEQGLAELEGDVSVDVEAAGDQSAELCATVDSESGAQRHCVGEGKDFEALTGPQAGVQEEDCKPPSEAVATTATDVITSAAPDARDDGKASPPAAPALPSSCLPLSPQMKARTVTHRLLVEESMPQAVPAVAAGAAAAAGAPLKNGPLTPERLHWGFISPPARSVAMRSSKSALRSRQQRATRMHGPFLSPSMIPASHNATAQWIERTELGFNGREGEVQSSVLSTTSPAKSSGDAHVEEIMTP